MKKKSRRPTWFRVYGAYRIAIDNLPDAAVGQGLKLALRYFETGNIEGTPDAMAEVVFNLLRQGCDESLTEYHDRVLDGIRGAEAKEQRNKELMERVRELEQMYCDGSTDEGG